MTTFSISGMLSRFLPSFIAHGADLLLSHAFRLLGIVLSINQMQQSLQGSTFQTAEVGSADWPGLSHTTPATPCAKCLNMQHDIDMVIEPLTLCYNFLITGGEHPPNLTVWLWLNVGHESCVSCLGAQCK
uniref:Uncharacterized protein n=1 Tax=Eutreptiella gymnastica TaxID=73025 RepID=A0A7S4CSD6_9EUGL